MPQQTMHLQKLFRGINESLLTEGTPDSIAIALDGINQFDEQHRHLLLTIGPLQLRNILRLEIGPVWEDLRNEAQQFLQVNDVSSADDVLMMRYGRFLVAGEELLTRVQRLAHQSEQLTRDSARQLTLMVLAVNGLMLLAMLWLFRHLYRIVAIPLNRLRTTMLDVSDGDGEVLERIDRNRHHRIETDHLQLHQEVDALRHAFNFMLTGIQDHLTSRKAAEHALQALNQALEQRVLERTKALSIANTRMRTEIEQHEKTQQALEEAKRNNSRILQAAGEGIFGTDTQGRLTFANPAAALMLGRQAEELVGKDVHSLIHHSRVDGTPYPVDECCALVALHSGERQQRDDELFWRRDGTVFPVEYVATPVVESDRHLSMVVVFKDITERKRVEQELKLAANVYQEVPLGIMVTDPDGVILRVNQAFVDITGYQSDEIVGKTPGLLRPDRHPEDSDKHFWRQLIESGTWQGETWNRRKNGTVYPVWLSVSSVRDPDGQIIRFVSVFNDISEKKLSEEQIYRLAHYDLLTELPNRALFNKRLDQALVQTQRRNRHLAVMFLDLDRFKTINDTLGHPVGDRLLEVVSQRIVESLRPDDIVSRIGGDEFTILLKDVNGNENISRIAQHLLDAIAQPTELEGHHLSISASIGISLYPEDGRDVDTLQCNADIAMYQAKEAGKGTFRFFTDSMNRTANERLELESALRRATVEGGFELVYQPQVELRQGRVIGVECLLRWKHPQKGYIGPDRFIPVAEETGLIVPFGSWVLQTACAQFSRWRDEGLTLPGFSINLSARQFRDPGLSEKVRQALQVHGVDPSCLELELTESCVMDDPEQSIAILCGFKEMGVRFAVDDFGIAYSSLGYLKRLPIDRLKIDRSFVRDIPDDADDAAITATIIAMAHNLGLQVIAEGVETQQQLDFLRRKACDELQGYLFSRPLNGQDLHALLRKEPRLET